MKRILAILISLVTITSLAACLSDSNSTTKNEIEVGATAYLYQGSATAFVGIDEESLSALEESLAANDKAGFSKLIDSGRVLHVPANTKVLVLRKGLAVKVRILEGEYGGKVVWTDSAWISPTK